MRTEQHHEVVTQLAKGTIKSRSPLGLIPTPTSTLIVTEQLSENHLCVSAEKSGITKLTVNILQHMWRKAE